VHEEPSGIRRIFSNLGHLLGGKAAAGLISLGYLIIVTRALGAHNYGILVLVHSYVMLVSSIVTFSGWHVIVYYGTQALRDDDRSRLMKLVRSMAVIEFGLALVAIAIVIVSIPLIGPRLGWSTEVMRLVALYSLAIISGVRATAQGLVQLVRRVDLLGMAQLTAPLIRLLGSVVIWFAGGGLTAFILLWLGAAIVDGLVIWLLGFWSLQKVRANERLWGPVRGVRSENAGFVKFIASTNADITLRDFSPALVPIVVGWMLGPTAAGLFSLAQRAAVILQHPARFLCNSAFSTFAELVAARDFAGLRRLVWRTNLIVLGAALPFLLLVYALGARLMVWLGGASFSDGRQLMLMLAIGQAAYLANPTFSAALLALGRATTSIAINVGTQIGLLPLLLLFIALGGLAGVGWYAIMSGAIASVTMTLAFARAVSGSPPRDLARDRPAAYTP
jgi:O-antigen/teichoic acid export membrane protein